jgi:hypothetical protein
MEKAIKIGDVKKGDFPEEVYTLIKECKFSFNEFLNKTEVAIGYIEIHSNSRNISRKILMNNSDKDLYQLFGKELVEIRKQYHKHFRMMHIRKKFIPENIILTR